MPTRSTPPPPKQRQNAWFANESTPSRVNRQTSSGWSSTMPREILLEHIVGRAGAQALDRALFAERAGDENERHRRIARAHDRERVGTRERGQVVVGEHQVPIAFVERGRKLGRSFDAPGIAREPPAFDEREFELGVRRIILEHEHPQAATHRERPYGPPPRSALRFQSSHGLAIVPWLVWSARAASSGSR